MEKHLSSDPVMRRVIRAVKTPLALDKDGGDIYTELLKAIVYQQITVKAAATIYGRFLDLVNNDPVPARVVSLSAETLRSAGVSKQKGTYMRNVAAYFADPANAGTSWKELSDKEILRRLTSIKGVGSWTVKMLLMFPLDRPDVFPEEDLGIQQSMQALYEIEETGRALQKTMIRLAEPWRPYRTLACRYLWAWKRMQTGR